MYHLLDEDQLDLNGFNVFGPGITDTDIDTNSSGAGATAAATAAAPSVAAAAKPKDKKDKANKGGARAVVMAAGEKGKGQGKVTGSTTGTQRGKAGCPVEGMDKEEIRRLGLYAAFLLPLADSMCPNRKRAKVSVFLTVNSV